ncbi:hypothetical protein E2C01_012730 [Portunus trituberculatus]|uniref:Uncharacterized protein n=1 Tax=Portunus trituberculatus TaxID=210409 RepID=A0A5B7DED7_PORTR|nr:hypothetical protein [Portunus trituberculatus]
MGGLELEFEDGRVDCDFTAGYDIRTASSPAGGRGPWICQGSLNFSLLVLLSSFLYAVISCSRSFFVAEHSVRMRVSLDQWHLTSKGEGGSGVGRTG